MESWWLESELPFVAHLKQECQRVVVATAIPLTEMASEEILLNPQFMLSIGYLKTNTSFFPPPPQKNKTKKYSSNPKANQEQKKHPQKKKSEHDLHNKGNAAVLQIGKLLHILYKVAVRRKACTILSLQEGNIFCSQIYQSGLMMYFSLAWQDIER